MVQEKNQYMTLHYEPEKIYRTKNVHTSYYYSEPLDALQKLLLYFGKNLFIYQKF